MEPDRKYPDDILGRDHAAAEQAAKRETRRLLRDLVGKAVPAVPRKLNRVGELFRLCLEVARENGWGMTERKEQLTLLRLVILQLLAPDLYRFGRHNPGFLNKLEDWCEKYGKPVNLTLLDDNLRDRIKQSEEALKVKPDDPQAAGELYTLRRLDQELLNRVRVAQQHRSRFDPFNLIDLDHRCDDGIHKYFNLELGEVTQKPITGVVSVTVGDLAMGADGVTVYREMAHATDDGTPAAPSDPEGFFNQLFSGDEIAWRNAIEQEAERLNGHVLDNSSFQSLLDRVRRAPNVVNVRWLEQLDPYLSADQLVALYRESKLLQRLNDAIQGEQPQ